MAVCGPRVADSGRDGTSKLLGNKNKAVAVAADFTVARAQYATGPAAHPGIPGRSTTRGRRLAALSFPVTPPVSGRSVTCPDPANCHVDHLILLVAGAVTCVPPEWPRVHRASAAALSVTPLTSSCTGVLVIWGKKSSVVGILTRRAKV